MADLKKVEQFLDDFIYQLPRVLFADKSTVRSVIDVGKSQRVVQFTAGAVLGCVTSSAITRLLKLAAVVAVTGAYCGYWVLPSVLSLKLEAEAAAKSTFAKRYSPLATHYMTGVVGFVFGYFILPSF